MGTRQDPRAHSRIALQHGCIEEFDSGGYFHVAKLPKVEVTTLGASRPTEKYVAGRLQQALPDYHALSFVAQPGGVEILGDHRCARFLDLQEERLSPAIDQKHHEAERPDAAHTDNLERNVLYGKPGEQFPTVGRECVEVFVPRLVEPFLPGVRFGPVALSAEE